MEKNNIEVANKNLGVPAVVCVFVLLACFLPYVCFRSAAKTNAKAPTASAQLPSAGAIVMRDYLAGKPIKRSVFFKTFESDPGSFDRTKIIRTAMELKLSAEETSCLFQLFGWENQVISFSGDPNKIPEKFRLGYVEQKGGVPE